MNRFIGSLPSHLRLVNDSQDAEAVRQHIGPKAAEYYSFFVHQEEGEYLEVWGYEGIVPYNWKRAWRIVP